MAWQGLVTSTALTLSGSLQTVQLAAADMEHELKSLEEAHIQFLVDFQTTPTEDVEIRIMTAPEDLASAVFDTEPYQTIVIRQGNDPARQSVVLRGVRAFRFDAQVIDPDGTAGGDDTSSTLVVKHRRNNVDGTV